MPISIEERRSRMKELTDLQDEWLRVFGKELGIGFDIGIAEVPLIDRCIRERNQEPLWEHLRSRDPNRDY